jgi:hypothetical protein
VINETDNSIKIKCLQYNKQGNIYTITLNVRYPPVLLA